MNDLRAYKIGDAVSVSAIVIVEEASSGWRILLRTLFATPRDGLIVGAQRVYPRRSRETLGLFQTIGQPNICRIQGQMEVGEGRGLWRVSFGLLNVPVLVLPENLTPAKGFRRDRFPLVASEFSELRRELLSEAAKARPRDKAGRFLKQGD